MRFPRVEREAHEPSCSQAKQPHHLRRGKTATRLLPAGIGPARAVFLRVGHRQTAAVEHLHGPATPAPRVLGMTLDPAAELIVSRVQRRQRQPDARLTIRAGIFIGRRALPGHAPRLHPAHGLTARAASIEHLAKEGDERDPRGINALPPALARREQLSRNETRHQRRQPVEPIRLPLDFARRHPPTTQTMRETRKIGGRILHSYPDTKYE